MPSPRALRPCPPAAVAAQSLLQQTHIQTDLLLRSLEKSIYFQASPLPCQPGHLPGQQHFGCFPWAGLWGAEHCCSGCNGFSHPYFLGWGGNGCPVPSHRPLQAVPALAPIPGAPGLLARVSALSGVLRAVFSCLESLKRPKFGVFSFPTQMIHCTFLCKQWVDPSWISGSDTQPIPGLGSCSSTLSSPRPPNLSCSKEQVEGRTCGPPTLHNACRGGKSPSVPQARLLDAGELPCTPRCPAPLAVLHPSLPTRPPQAPVPIPAEAPPAWGAAWYHSGLTAPASRSLRKAGCWLRANRLSPPTVP